MDPPDSNASKHMKAIGFILFLIHAAMLAGCSDRSEAQSGSPASAADASTRPGTRHGPFIVATIHPLAALAGELVSDWSEVHTLFPDASSDDHAPRPLTEKRAELLARADVFLYIGEGFDDDALRAFECVKGPPGRRAVSFAALTGIDKISDGKAPPAKAAKPTLAIPEPGSNSKSQPTVVRVPTPGDPSAAPTSDPAGGDANPIPLIHLRVVSRGVVAPWLNAAAAERYVGGLCDAFVSVYPDKQESLRGRSHLFRANLIQYDRTLSRLIAAAPPISRPGDNDPINVFVRRYGLRVQADTSANDAKRLSIDAFGGPDQPDRRTYRELLDYNLNILLRSGPTPRP